MKSNERRNEVSATENKSSFLEILHKTPCYVTALDESCDIFYIEQIPTFVRYLEIVKVKHFWVRIFRIISD